MTTPEYTGRKLSELMRREKIETRADLHILLKRLGIDVSLTSVQRWASGHTLLRYDVAEALADHYGFNFGWFYSPAKMPNGDLVVRKAGEIIFRTQATLDITVSIERS